MWAWASTRSGPRCSARSPTRPIATRCGRSLRPARPAAPPGARPPQAVQPVVVHRSDPQRAPRGSRCRSFIYLLCSSAKRNRRLSPPRQRANGAPAGPEPNFCARRNLKTRRRWNTPQHWGWAPPSQKPRAQENPQTFTSEQWSDARSQRASAPLPEAAGTYVLQRCSPQLDVYRRFNYCRIAAVQLSIMCSSHLFRPMPNAPLRVGNPLAFAVANCSRDQWNFWQMPSSSSSRTGGVLTVDGSSAPTPQDQTLSRCGLDR